jgi:hypothetical protein
MKIGGDRSIHKLQQFRTLSVSIVHANKYPVSGEPIPLKGHS